MKKLEPHPVDTHVGRRLRSRRTILGLSQEELGDAVNITFQQIQKYERGSNRIGSSRLYEFAKILNVDVSYFFEDYEDDRPKGYEKVNQSSQRLPFEYPGVDADELLTLVNAYYGITDDKVKRHLLEMICSMAGTQPTKSTESSKMNVSERSMEAVQS